MQTNMEEESVKREIPPMLRTVLAFDIQFTEHFVKWVENFMPMRQLKLHYTALEITCHGILWFSALLASIWVFNSKSLYQMQVNLLIALLLDIIIIGLIKAFVRRRRPVCTDDPFAMGPDKYSFPSGHASRALLVSYFFIYLWPVPMMCVPPLLAWVVAVSLSRLLMKRHYILDVLAGLLIGYGEGLLASLVFLERDTCLSFISWITDEKIDGAEYDV